MKEEYKPEALRELTAQEAARQYLQGFHCSQVVFAHAAEALGVPTDLALRIGATFGGGMFQGNVCGCVTGALMALGCRYGHDRPFDQTGSEEAKQYALEFQERFAAENGGTLCRELLGCDIRTPGALEQAMRICPRYAESACAILDELLG